MKQLAHRKHRFDSILRANGPDTREFLQGQFSQDLSMLRAGELAYGLWLDRKGKILADSFVLCQGDQAFMIASYFCPEETIFNRLDDYLIMEEVEIERATLGSCGLTVWGDEALSMVVSHLEVDLPEKGGFVSSGPVVAFWGQRGAEQCLEILGTGSNGENAVSEILEKVEAAGSRALSEWDLDRMAIEGVLPRIGRGFGDADLPQEIGLEKTAVSFNKGCYLGQEVMARLHSMGKARKRLQRVSIEGANTSNEVTLPLDLLDEDGKKQGVLRAAAYSKSGGNGLAIINLRFSGSVLQSEELRVEWEDE